MLLERLHAVKRLPMGVYGDSTSSIGTLAFLQQPACPATDLPAGGRFVACDDVYPNSTDITQAWHSNGAVINEVNYAPLLGGGEISRSHIASHLSRMLKNQGKTPIKTIQGG